MVHLAVTLALSLDPKSILDSLSPYGEIGLMLIIFAETGLLVGFFLPGDSLMFTAGLLASQGSLNLALVLVGCFAAAVIGDQVGFTIGEVVGPRIGRNPNAKVIKPEYIERTHAFFDRHGPKTIMLARFVPIVRTFTPVVAGVARMRRSVFLRYNVVGAGLWVAVATMLGYLLADLIGDSIDTYILPIIGVIVLVSLIPPFLEWRKHRKATPIDEESGLEQAPSEACDADRRRGPHRASAHELKGGTRSAWFTRRRRPGSDRSRTRRRAR
jgi:membrane-associated protein